MGDREEWEMEELCTDCGGSVVPDRDPCFFFEEEILCFECAQNRGGRYDSEYEQWATFPDISELHNDHASP